MQKVKPGRIAKMYGIDMSLIIKARTDRLKKINNRKKNKAARKARRAGR